MHPDEYPWLVRIFAWADEGVASDEIARRLTDEGVPTKSGQAAWRSNTVNGILDNPFYKGELVWGRQQVRRDENGKPYLEVRAEDDPGRVVRESPLGAIINVDLWDRVNARRLAKRGQRRMKKRTVPENALDGAVFCGRCGHRMYARLDNPGRYKTVRIRFYCPGTRPGMVAKDGFDQCRKVNTMLADRIVKGIGSQPIRGGATVEVTVTRGTAEVDHDRKRQRLLARLAEAEAEWANAKRLAIKGLLDDDDLSATKAETDAVISHARATLIELGETATVEVLPFVGTVAGRFAELAEGLADESVPVSLRQALLRDFGVARIYVDNPAIRVELL